MDEIIKRFTKVAEIWNTDISGSVVVDQSVLKFVLKASHAGSYMVQAQSLLKDKVCDGKE